MSEKVRLPKAVCDALDSVKDELSISNILMKSARNNLDIPYELVHCDLEKIARALIIGYEPELTPEEEIIRRFFDNSWKNSSEYRCYQIGIRDALRIHGIKYDWLDGAE